MGRVSEDERHPGVLWVLSILSVKLIIKILHTVIQSVNLSLHFFSLLVWHLPSVLMPFKEVDEVCLIFQLLLVELSFVAAL